MRVFIAVPIPDPCLKILDQMQHYLKRSDAEVRWTAIYSIHLTLKFLGETTPETVSGISGKLRASSNQVQTLDLRLSGLGCFPNLINPRVIWCGIRGDVDALSQLQRMVESVCNDFGFLPEGRPFHPHLTLGRIKGKRNLQQLTDCITKGSDLECSFSAGHYNIYKSVLKPQGAVYTVLETIALKQA